MFKKLLVPLDRSELAEAALGHAAGIARACGASVDFVLVHEFASATDLVQEPTKLAQRHADERYLSDIAAEFAVGASVTTTHGFAIGAVPEAITERARAVGADLIVMTSHGRTGLSRAWLGSVADTVIRNATVPVMMLRAKTRRAPRRGRMFKHVLVPVYDPLEASAILDAAAALAGAFGAQLTLLRVLRPAPLVTPDITTAFASPPILVDDAATDILAAEAAQELEVLAARLREKASIPVDAVVLVAEGVAQAIIDVAAARSVDLIAMTSHGRGASRLFIESVTDKVIRATGVPVLLLRPPAE